MRRRHKIPKPGFDATKRIHFGGAQCRVWLTRHGAKVVSDSQSVKTLAGLCPESGKNRPAIRNRAACGCLPLRVAIGPWGTLQQSERLEPIWPEGKQMKMQKVYTSLLTSDLASAEGWYTKLLGRGPDYRPMDTMVQWELFNQGGVALSTSDEIAGKGVMFLIVDDVAAERRRLQALGIALGDDIKGDYSTLAQVRDPDGNLLTLATPPSRPYPPA